MPMPRKTKGENKQEWVSKCISAEMKKGHSQEVSIAMCMGQWTKMEQDYKIETAALKLKK